MAKVKSKKASKEVETPIKKKKVKAAEVATKAKASKKAVKVPAKKAKSKGDVELTPIQKAQLARQANKGKKKAPAKKSALPTWKAPSDFKPFHLVVEFTTEKDGMLGSDVKAVRYVGAIAADKDERKMFDMSAYDQPTLTAIASRLSMVLFHPTGRPSSKGVPSRLPGNTKFTLHIRVGKNKDGLLTARVNKVFALQKSAKTGKMKTKELDKTEVAVRKIRKVNRYFAAAFKNVLATPKRTTRRRKEADDE